MKLLSASTPCDAVYMMSGSSYHVPPDRWRAAETIQSCAPRNNDDWYWLYAAVFTGGRVLVLTNDEMRDHHFSMLSHRSFERWKERHQVRCHTCPSLSAVGVAQGWMGLLFTYVAQEPLWIR